MKVIFICTIILFTIVAPAQYSTKLVEVGTIKGRISPKSIVHNGKGVFFAQNMMYRHTITVYNRAFELVKTISDKVKLSEYGYLDEGSFRGSPVECVFSHAGKYAWVSNYYMSGNGGFNHPGCDNCQGTKEYDSSFVYKINTANNQIEDVIRVGSIPKYLAVTPDSKTLLVTNWTSGDISIINTEKGKEIKRLKLGRYPRGIAISPKGEVAYIAIMGSNKVAVLNLTSFAISWIRGVGKSPRHLCLSPNGRVLYVSLNREGKIIKIHLDTQEMISVKTGRMPRSMSLSSNGRYLYVVNYGSNTLVKLRTDDLTVMDEVATKSKPIGITLDEAAETVWVANYSGSIQIFQNKMDYQELEQSPDLAYLIQNNNLFDVLNIPEWKEDVIAVPEIKNTIENNSDIYLLVAGSYASNRNAKKKQHRLIDKHKNTQLYYNKHKDLYYVIVATETTKEKSKESQRNLKQNGLKTWVYARGS